MITTNNKTINFCIRSLYADKMIRFRKDTINRTDYNTVSFYLCQISNKPDSCIIIENLCDKNDKVLSYKMAVIEDMSKLPCCLYNYMVKDDYVLTYIESISKMYKKGANQYEQ